MARHLLRQVGADLGRPSAPPPGSVSSLLFALICVAIARSSASRSATQLRQRRVRVVLLVRARHVLGRRLRRPVSYRLVRRSGRFLAVRPAGLEIARIRPRAAGQRSALRRFLRCNHRAAKSYRDLLWRLREEEDRRQLLTHELAHRIKNTLSIVQSLIRQTLRDQPAASASSALASPHWRRRTIS